jgi:CheY-like chemotaxis protein
MIFVVDDERVIADTLCAILRCSGYEARAFYEAESALVACEEQLPDLVLSDVSMPGMNGTELAVMLKDRFPRCEVLLFTGAVASRDLLRAAREKGYEFELLTKPVHPKELLARLERAVPREARADTHAADSNAMAG